MSNPHPNADDESSTFPQITEWLGEGESERKYTIFGEVDQFLAHVEHFEVRDDATGQYVDERSWLGDRAGEAGQSIEDVTNTIEVALIERARDLADDEAADRMYDPELVPHSDWNHGVRR